jgi:hypothetical protein
MKRYHVLSGFYLWLDTYNRWRLLRAYKAEAQKLRDLLRQKREAERWRVAIEKQYEGQRHFWEGLAQQSTNAQLSALNNAAYQQNMAVSGGLNDYLQSLNRLGGYGGYLRN